MNAPTISIIVPVYNAAQYLRRCIDSILSQSFTDFELLLIDDGSTDESNAICDEYAAKDERTRVFHKENGGVSSARNLGLDNAQGDWIYFVDADDWVEDEFGKVSENLATGYDWYCYGSIKKKQNESVEYVIFDEVSLNNLLDIEKYIVLQKEKHYREFLGVLWNKFYKTEIIRIHNLRFCEDIRYKEDDVFNCNYLSHIQSLRVSKNVVYGYRIIEGSLCHRTIDFQMLYRLCQQLEIAADAFSNILKKDILERFCRCAMLSIYGISISKRIYLAKQVLRYSNQYQLTTKKIVRKSLKFGIFGAYILSSLTYFGNIRRKLRKINYRYE